MDGEYSARVPADVVRELGLEEGAASDEVRAVVEYYRAGTLIRRLLRRRRRTRAEFQRALLKEGFDGEFVAAYLRVLEKDGVVDDGAFAAAWIRDRLRLKPKGHVAIRRELSAKGVAPEVITEALAEHYCEDEENVARRALGNRVEEFRRRGGRRGRVAMAGYLYRRGFRGEVVRRLLSEFLPDTER